MNIAETLLSTGEDLAAAVISKTGALTYRELRDEVRRVAVALSRTGCAKGDRVGLVAENGPFFIAAYLGIIRAGLTAVPLQPDLPEPSFQKIVADAGMALLFVSRRHLNRIRPWVSSSMCLLVEGELVETPAGREGELPEVDPMRDLAALVFTSGSTGAPKGVMVTHRNIECNTRDICAYMGLTSADRVMVVLPFHYCFGISLLHTALLAGGSVVINNDFRLYPETVLQDMQQRGCTGFAGVPSTYQILLRKSRFRTLDFPKLRWLQQAGGKLPDPQIAEIVSAFPAIRYYLMYGQTEATARLSYLPPERLSDKLGSIGKGLPSTRLEVLKPDGSPVEAGSTDTGEILASGDNITLGYWHDPEETRRYFRHGKLHTGDIARVDQDGFIYIVDRDRDIIKCGGNRVSAKEVENVLAELPEVVEAAVVGAPHELLGESIKAFAVPVPGARISAQGAKEHCRKRLPGFKVPDEVLFVRDLPHNSAGKVLKEELKEMLRMASARADGTITPDGACHGLKAAPSPLLNGH